MHSTQLIPLANFIDFLQGIAPIIFVILYGVAHLVGNLQQEKRKPPVRPRPRQAPPQPLAERPLAGGQPPAGNQHNLEDTLRREVEEFLRRAQGQPPQQQKSAAQQRQQPRQPQQRPAVQQRPAPQARPARQSERAAEPPTRRLVETARAEVPVAPTEPLRQTLGSPPMTTGLPTQVGGPLRTQHVAEHAAQLGADIAQTDERMQQHLRERFVHQVGALAPRTPSGQRQASASSMAQEVRNLISRPGGIKHLIIAGEILRRPEERWER